MEGVEIRNVDRVPFLKIILPNVEVDVLEIINDYARSKEEGDLFLFVLGEAYRTLEMKMQVSLITCDTEAAAIEKVQTLIKYQGEYHSEEEAKEVEAQTAKQLAAEELGVEWEDVAEDVGTDEDENKDEDDDEDEDDNKKKEKEKDNDEDEEKEDWKEKEKEKKKIRKKRKRDNVENYDGNGLVLKKEWARFEKGLPKTGCDFQTYQLVHYKWENNKITKVFAGEAVITGTA